MRAQTAVELAIGLKPVCPNCRGARRDLSEITPLELALAVRSGPIGVHNDDGRKKEKEEEEGRATPFIKIQRPCLAGGVGKSYQLVSSHCLALHHGYLQRAGFCHVSVYWLNSGYIPCFLVGFRLTPRTGTSSSGSHALEHLDVLS